MPWTKRPTLYARWNNMRARCYNEKHNSYPYYGAKGIKVCERWSDFSAFEADMLPSYVEGLTLERLDNSDDYTPENTTWATITTQNRHKSNIVLNELQVRVIHRLLEFGTMTQVEIGSHFGISQSAVSQIKLGKRWA